MVNPLPKPVLMVVDDDAGVLRAVSRDLRRQGYRIVRAESGNEALGALAELKQRGDAVALLLSDQRMPHLNGAEFLAQAALLFPDAKRALLTAYADTEAAIRAINEARVHYYLTKPWGPPEEELYPVVDDLLGDWQGEYKPGYGGLKVVGDRWSPESHELRDFLARNGVPYTFSDLETQPQAAARAAAPVDSPGTSRTARSVSRSRPPTCAGHRRPSEWPTCTSSSVRACATVST